jgi:Fibronectin type III domain
MRQLGLRLLTLGKNSTSQGVSLTRNRRSRLSVERLERRDLLAGMLTGVAYEIDAVTGTDYDGLPYIQSVESTGNLTTASGGLPIQYNEQFPPGYSTMNGTVNFTFPQTVTPGQTASVSASAQATWNNSGLGFGRPTSIDIGDGIGPDGLDDKGSFANGTTSAQVNWSDSVAVPTGPGSVSLPPVTVTVDGKEDKIITLTASYNIVADTPSVTTDPADQSVCDGMDATFTVAGDGDPTPDVQWEESDNGGSFYPIPGATGYTLVVTAHAPMNFANAPSNDGSQFRAVLSNSSGTATSAAATLHVDTMPVITLNPVSQAAEPGQTVTFTAHADGTPTPVAQWQTSSDGGTIWDDMANPGSDPDSFTYAVQPGDDGLLFRAVYTNDCADDPTTAPATDPATLTVTSTPGPYLIYELPEDGCNRFVAIANSPDPDFGKLYTIQVGGEDLLVQPNAADGLWYIVARGLDGTTAAALPPGSPVQILSESTQPTLQLFADVSGDSTLAISDAPSPVDHSWAFKIQIGSEQMLIQEPGTTVFDDWNILARGVDGTLEQSHAQGAPIQFLGEACCDAGWDFLPNQPETSPYPDIIAGTAIVPGPELVVDPSAPKLAEVQITEFDRPAGDTPQVIIVQESTGSELMDNLPNGLDVTHGIENLEGPIYSVHLAFSADPNAPPGITPITVIVHQAGEDDITLFLNLVVPQPVTLAPNPPNKVTAQAVSSSQINLSWDAAPGATGYVVEQFIGGNFKEIASVGGNITSSSVGGLSPGTEYEFRVGAFNSANPTDPSFEVGYPVAKTFPTAPPRPPATVQHVSIVKSKQGKHKTTEVIKLQFDQAMNVGAAENRSSYSLVTVPKGKKRKGTAVALAKAAYDPATFTVTLTTRKPLVLNPPIKLTLEALRLPDALGRPLDLGTNFVVVLTDSGVRKTGAGSAVIAVRRLISR